MGNSEQKTCSKHGDYQSTFFKLGKIEAWSPCPGCLTDSELKRQNEDKEKAQELKQEALQNKFKRAGIPARFLNKTFESYECATEKQTKVLNVCKRYADNFSTVLENGVNLVMIGNSGSGKNHLAMAIANQVIRQRNTAMFVDAYMMLSDIKHAQQSNSERETDAIRALSKPDLLIIDELGDQVGSDADKRLLNKIINQRYNDKRPCILISNLKYTVENGVGLKDFLGTRIITRISEGGGKILLFDWENYRSNIKTNNLWEG